MVEQELDLLICNLNKKAELLVKMSEVLDKQLQFLDESELQLEELDSCMEIQSDLTEELESLNNESDAIYEYLQTVNISTEGGTTSKIVRIRELLSQITTDFANLQEKEQSTKQRLEAFFQKERKNFGTGRRSSKAALDYYKNMSGANVVSAQFMDQKK